MATRVRPGIGLNMIVKDEADVIARCLRNVYVLVDWWVIVDTGSSDATMDIIREEMRGKPGELHQRPWVDFAHNRNEALNLARASSLAFPDDYAYFVDADEVTLWHSFEEPGKEGLDGYNVRVDYGTTTYPRMAFARLDRPWTWVGPVHEVLHFGDGVPSIGRADVSVNVYHDGARSKDPESYHKDAVLLAKHLVENPGDTRTAFYYAQSLKDAGEYQEALDAYIRRIEMGGWTEEVWYSHLQVARLSACLPQWHTHFDVRGAYLEAYQYNPKRAEPLVELARYCRSRGEYDLSVMFAKAACDIPHPDDDALFVEETCYTWAPWDEWAISAYYIEDPNGLAAARRALEFEPRSRRLTRNLDFWEARKQGMPS